MSVKRPLQFKLVLSFTAFILFLWIFHLFVFQTITVTITANVEDGDLWEVYYNTGNGYNAHEVVTKRADKDGKLNDITFKIPQRDIESFRIDPPSDTRSFHIASICLETFRKEFCWLPDQIQKYFQPLHHISAFSVLDGMLYIQSGGNDPYFSLDTDLSDIFGEQDDSISSVYFFISLLLAVFIFFLIDPAGSWFQNNRKQIISILQLRFPVRALSEKTGTGIQKKYIRYTIVFVLIFGYLLCWGLIKPPGQSPDEFAHFTKALSVPQYPWFLNSFSVQLRKQWFNPILGYGKLHLVPFHYKEKFTPDDFQAMKAMEWMKGEGSLEVYTSAYSYPVFYYALLFLSSHLIISIFSLNPFDSFYTYRIVTVLYTSLLWLWVYAALKNVPLSSSYRRTLFWGILLIPMLGFITSSINPDAFAIPLINLFIIYSFQAFIYDKDLVKAVLVFLLSLFSKPAALILFPVLILMAGGSLWFTKKRKKMILNFFLLTFLPFIISYACFYLWSSPVLHGTPLTVSLLDYVQQLFHKLPGYFVMYWGNLGWLDYSLDRVYYKILFILIVLNCIACLFDYRKLIEMKWPVYAFFFALVFCAGVIGGEYHYLSRAGYTIQGRYFLPVAIGLSVFLVHRALLLRYVFIGYLLFLNAALVQEHFIRYFGFRAGDYLPFF